MSETLSGLIMKIGRGQIEDICIYSIYMVCATHFSSEGRVLCVIWEELSVSHIYNVVTTENEH